MTTTIGTTTQGITGNSGLISYIQNRAAVLPDGSLVIIYNEGTSTSYSTGGLIVLRSLNWTSGSPTWSLEYRIVSGVSQRGALFWDSSTNTLHICAADLSNGKSGIDYVSANYSAGTLNWGLVTAIPNISTTEASSQSICVDGNGTIFIIYRHQTGSTTSVYIVANVSGVWKTPFQISSGSSTTSSVFFGSLIRSGTNTIAVMIEAGNYYASIHPDTNAYNTWGVLSSGPTSETPTGTAFLSGPFGLASPSSGTVFVGMATNNNTHPGITISSFTFSGTAITWSTGYQNLNANTLDQAGGVAWTKIGNTLYAFYHAGASGATYDIRYTIYNISTNSWGTEVNLTNSGSSKNNNAIVPSTGLTTVIPIIYATGTSSPWNVVQQNYLIPVASRNTIGRIYLAIMQGLNALGRLSLAIRKSRSSVGRLKYTISEIRSGTGRLLIALFNTAKKSGKGRVIFSFGYNRQGIGRVLLLSETTEITVLIDNASVLSTTSYDAGFSYIDTSLEYPHGSNDATAVAAVKSLISAAFTYQSTPIMAWGKNDPWPDPMQLEPTVWDSLDSAIQHALDTETIPVITLCEAPWWMKGGLSNGITSLIPDVNGDFASHTYTTSIIDYRGLSYAAGYVSPDPMDSRILDNQFPAWLHLVQRIAERYMVAPYNVTHFQIWKGMRGYYNNSTNTYDYTISSGNSTGTSTPYGINSYGSNTYGDLAGYNATHGYTYFYNQTYTQLLTTASTFGIDPSSLTIGGPGISIDTYGGSQVDPSALVTPYGIYDQRVFDVIEYWLQHNAGAGFISLIASNTNKDNIILTDEFTAAQVFADTVNWIRSHDPTLYPNIETLPVWFIEWYTNVGADAANKQHAAALAAYATAKFIEVGGAVLFAYGGEGAGTTGVGLWTTTTAGGGIPTPWCNAQELISQTFPVGTRLHTFTTTDPFDIEMLTAAPVMLLINKTAFSQTAIVNGTSILLPPYGVQTSYASDTTYNNYRNIIAPNLATALNAKNLLTHAQLIGPETTMADDGWLTSASNDLAATLAGYIRHAFPSGATDISGDTIETAMTGLTNTIIANDPNSYVIQGEMGDGFYGPGQQVGGYQYGVEMTDFAVQLARSNLSACIAYLLDDDMNGTQWGLWHLTDGTGAQLRPWFFTWSLLCNAIQKGSTIYAPALPSTNDIRVLAAVSPSGSWTFVIVNRRTSTQDIQITIPFVPIASTTFQQYVYDAQIPLLVDGNGFPLAASSISVVLARGFTVAIGPNAVVILTQQQTAQTVLYDVPRPPLQKRR